MGNSVEVSRPEPGMVFNLEWTDGHPQPTKHTVRQVVDGRVYFEEGDGWDSIEDFMNDSDGLRYVFVGWKPGFGPQSPALEMPRWEVGQRRRGEIPGIKKNAEYVVDSECERVGTDGCRLWYVKGAGGLWEVGETDPSTLLTPRPPAARAPGKGQQWRDTPSGAGGCDHCVARGPNGRCTIHAPVGPVEPVGPPPLGQCDWHTDKVRCVHPRAHRKVTPKEIGVAINAELLAWYRSTGGRGPWFELSDKIAAAIEARDAESECRCDPLVEATAVTCAACDGRREVSDEALRHLRKWHSPGVCKLGREHACDTCDFIEAAATPASPKEAP